MEKKITANKFAREAGLYPVQVVRMIEKGEIKGIKTKVVKMEYRIPISELKKFKR